MHTDKWATSKSTQLSTKVWVKLLPLLENALKLNFHTYQNRVKSSPVSERSAYPLQGEGLNICGEIRKTEGRHIRGGD